jgi:hypothetical protein
VDQEDLVDQIPYRALGWDQKKVNLDGTGLETSQVQAMNRSRAGTSIRTFLESQANQYLGTVMEVNLKVILDGIGLGISPHQVDLVSRVGTLIETNQMNQEGQSPGIVMEELMKVNLDGIGLVMRPLTRGPRATATTMMEKDPDLPKQMDRKNQHGIGGVTQRRTNQRGQDPGRAMALTPMIPSGAGLALNHLRTPTWKTQQLLGQLVTRMTTMARDLDPWLSLKTSMTRSRKKRKRSHPRVSLYPFGLCSMSEFLQQWPERLLLPRRRAQVAES